MAWQTGDVVGPTNLNAKTPAIFGFVFPETFGAVGDGVTDDTAAIQAAENSRTIWQVLKGTAGKTYALNANTGATVLKVKTSGMWDFTGATLKYTNAGQLTTGSDGNGLGVINFLADDISFSGTIDCNSNARYGITFQDIHTRFYLNCKIINTLETNGIWSGLYYASSIDITGVTVTSRAKNVFGFLSRPNCPLIDGSSNIIGHSSSTAVLIGDDTQVGNATGLALVSNNQIAPAICFQRMDTRGIDSFGFAGTANSFLGDIFCHDIGLNTCEFYGTSQTNSDGVKVPQSKRIGPIVKGLPSSNIVVGSGWWWNDAATGTDGPNVWIDGGSAQLGGLIDLNPISNAGAVSATQGGRLVENLITLTDAATITTDASQGNKFQVTLGGNRTVGAPTNARKGQTAVYTIVQDVTGGRTLAWNAIFKQAWSDAGNTFNKRSTISFTYDGTNWNQMAAQTPYV